MRQLGADRQHYRPLSVWLRSDNYCRSPPVDLVVGNVQERIAENSSERVGEGGGFQHDKGVHGGDKAGLWVRCGKFADHIPTDLITPTHIMFKTAREMAKFVLETVNPDFPKHVQPGDILVTGRNFGCSSGRALAAKALQATGIGAVAVPAGDARVGRPDSVIKIRFILHGGGPVTLLLSNEDVERALTHQDALSATEAILGELATGQAINRPRSQTHRGAGDYLKANANAPAGQ